MSIVPIGAVISSICSLYMVDGSTWSATLFVVSFKSFNVGRAGGEVWSSLYQGLPNGLIKETLSFLPLCSHGGWFYLICNFNFPLTNIIIMDHANEEAIYYRHETIITPPPSIMFIYIMAITCSRLLCFFQILSWTVFLLSAPRRWVLCRNLATVW